jgi:hypothetical protein
VSAIPLLAGRVFTRHDELLSRVSTANDQTALPVGSFRFNPQRVQNTGISESFWRYLFGNHHRDRSEENKKACQQSLRTRHEGGSMYFALACAGNSTTQARA